MLRRYIRVGVGVVCGYSLYDTWVCRMWVLLVCNGVVSSVDRAERCRHMCCAIYYSFPCLVSFPHMYETPGSEQMQPETESAGSESDDSKTKGQESNCFRG